MTKSVLSDAQVRGIVMPCDWSANKDQQMACIIAREIEQAVLQSPEMQQLRADKERLIAELKSLVRGYVGALESGRDRIVFLGGECDSLKRMEADDINLRSAKKLLAEMEQKP